MRPANKQTAEPARTRAPTAYARSAPCRRRMVVAMVRMKEDAAAKNLPPVYRGKWASASAQEVQAAKDAGLDYTYRFRVPKVRHCGSTGAAHCTDSSLTFGPSGMTVAWPPMSPCDWVWKACDLVSVSSSKREHHFSRIYLVRCVSPATRNTSACG